jgi:glycosyltransferase involved in cell wall biosynthesis
MAERRRICVCAAQVPFMQGGAEQHVLNLVAALEAAGHEVELVRLPVAWARDRLLASALAWRFVDVVSDMVIATNFPSYYIRHARKVVWLFHQHRVAYDAVDSEWSDFDLSEEALATQEALTRWDTRVLEEAVARFTTSREVADRLLRFNGLVAQPLYHPAPLQDALSAGGYGDYLFCASRIEANKRVDLAVRAVAEARTRPRLLIAGVGSQRPALQALIRKLGLGDRVELLGFVDDARLVDLFRKARAVLYPPHLEDYGYVTLQAFAAHKPVITASDSGGTLEWVAEGETGTVGEPTPESLAGAIDRVMDLDEGSLRAMGDRGFERVRPLRWETVVDTLVEAGAG